MDNPSAHADPPAAAATVSQSRASVLVVDDEVRIGQTLQRVLGAAGYDVSLATDGHTALEAIKSRRFDVIVSDINMPGMSGISLLRNVRTHDARRSGHPDDRQPDASRRRWRPSLSARCSTSRSR